METKTLNIYHRINEVRKDNEFIKKLKSVDNQYKVVTHDQVTDELREDLIKQGIVIEPFLISERTVQDTLMLAGVKKNPIIRMECVFDVFFVNMDEPKDRACYRLPAHALDTGDKAPGKAVSYVVKTAMLKAFNIVTGENDEDRAEKGVVGDEIDARTFSDWTAKIGELAGKSKADIDAAAQKLWEQIHENVTVKGRDAKSATKLRSILTNRVSVLKKMVVK